MQRTTVRWPMPFGCKAFPNEVLRAVRLGECGTVEEWLRDHDVNRADGGGFTLLLHAARYMAISETAKNVIGYLIKRGADVSQSDNGSWSALHYVASAHKIPGAIDAARLLLAAGAPINEQTKFTKRTPLGAVIHSFLCPAPLNNVFTGFYIHGESVDLIALLVRNGAALDGCCALGAAHSAEAMLLDAARNSNMPDKSSYDTMASVPYKTDDDEARCLEVQGLFARTRRLRDRYTLLRMRSLVLRGRATTTDDVMKSLFLRANHLVAKVYAFLPAQLGVK